MRLAAALVVLGVITCSACSLLTDFGGLASGANDASEAGDAGADGGGPRTDGASVVAEDGGDGASSDAGADGSWCSHQSGLTLCEDFDLPDSAAFTQWDEVHDNGGSAVIDMATSSSPPSSLLTIMPAGPPADLSLGKHFGAATTTRVAVDLLVEAIDTQGFANLAVISLSPTPPGYMEIDIVVRQSQDKVELQVYAPPSDGGSGGDDATMVSIGFASWHRVALQVSFANPATASVYDGAGNLLAQLPVPSVTPAGEDVTVGISYVDFPVKTGWRARFDNVAITTSN